jgi:hypothetical protein
MRQILVFWSAQLKRRSVQFILTALLSFLVTTGIQGPHVLEHYLYSKWQQSAQYADVIIGYKGSPLQIVASTLYRLENPTGNIDSNTVKFWSKHPLVQESCAISLGDNIKGYPLVGADHNYYSWVGINVIEGKLPQSPFEIAVPTKIALLLGIELGDVFYTSHGSDNRGEKHEHHKLTVSALIDGQRPTDNEAIFTTAEAYSLMHDGLNNGSITSLMLKLKSKSALLMLPRLLDNRPDEQGAFPVFIFAQLQKQWEPTLRKIRDWGQIVPIGIGIVFVSFAYFLGGTQREALAFLDVQKAPLQIKFFALYGLIILSGLFGILCTYLLMEIYLGESGMRSTWLWSLVPIGVSTVFYITQLIKR